MAHVFKGNIVNDEQYPMPAGTSTARGQSAAGGAPQQPAFDPAEVQQATNEVHQLLDAVAQMRPAVQQLSDAAMAGAQQQGYADGIARAQSEVQSQLIETMAALTDAQIQRHQFADQNQAELADLAVKIARSIIGKSLEADPALVGRIVADAIGELEPTTSLVVRVNAEDLPAVEQNRDAIERMVNGSGKIEIVADPTVDRGGAILASPVGEVDARVETKISILEAAFSAQRRSLQMGTEFAEPSYDSTVAPGAHAAPAYDPPAEAYHEPEPQYDQAIPIDDSGYGAPSSDDGGGYLSAPEPADGGYLSGSGSDFLSPPPAEDAGGGDYLNF